MEKYILCIDIGGTNIEYGIASKNGTIHHRNILKTNDYNDAEEFVNHLHSLLSKDGLIQSLSGIGVGAPNGNFHTGCIDNAPNLKWKGNIQLKAIFEKFFGIKTILNNDANATALGEKLFGNGRKYKDFVLITIGTGLGSGIISDNKLILGADSMAGEFGHIRVVNQGRDCNCGRKGCLERYASATGILDTFHELKPKFPDSSLANLENVTNKEIFAAYIKNDPLAQEIINFTTEVLGNALADFACFTNPRAYIFFGGIFKTESDFLAKTKGVMERNLLYIYKNKITIEQSGLKNDDAALLGALALFLEDL